MYGRKLASIVSSIHKNNINTDVVRDWCTVVTSVVHLLAYTAVFLVLGRLLVLIMKLFGAFEEDTNVEDFYSTETDPLIPTKTLFDARNYGTISEDDMNKVNRSSISNNNDSYSVRSSPVDLNDANLCVICYDGLKDCFLVPCGHCATCFICAQRIFYKESKTCPICRTSINKVRRLFPANLGGKS